jgi:transporter family protein
MQGRFLIAPAAAAMAEHRTGGTALTFIIYALLSAVFAAITSILAKMGIQNVNSNLATAIRTAVVLVMAWGMVFVTGKQGGISNISQRSWLFLILSGCATGLSWLFYYKALQMGPASRVIPIDKLSVVISMLLAFAVLGETPDIKAVIGGLLITAGTLVLAL